MGTASGQGIEPGSAPAGSSAAATQKCELGRQCVSCKGGLSGCRRPTWVWRAMRPRGLHLGRVHSLAIYGGKGQCLPAYAAAAAVGLEAACCLAPMAWTAVPVEVAWGGAGRGEVREQVGRAVMPLAPTRPPTSYAILRQPISCTRPQGLISSHPKQQRGWWKKCVSHATVLTMSATVQPRDRSFTGLARPCAEGEGLCSRT